MSDCCVGLLRLSALSSVGLSDLSDCQATVGLRVGIHCRRVGLSDRGRGSACAVPLASTLKPHVNGNNCQCHKTLYSTHTAPQQLYRLQLYSCRPGTGAAAGTAVPGVLRLPPLELQRPVW